MTNAQLLGNQKYRGVNNFNTGMVEELNTLLTSKVRFGGEFSNSTAYPINTLVVNTDGQIFITIRDVDSGGVLTNTTDFTPIGSSRLDTSALQDAVAQAQTAASNASTSASDASTSADASSTSAGESATSATQASTSASNASTSASDASTSADASSTSATQASTSAAQASTSASTASTSAEESSTSAGATSTEANTAKSQADKAQAVSDGIASTIQAAIDGLTPGGEG